MTEAVEPTPSGRTVRPDEVRVWDLFVRVFHWSLVGLFILAYITADEWDDVHDFSGYAIMVLIAVRVVWGFVGSRHARFSSFVYSPATVIGFLRDSVFLRAKRYIGHNPAGGAMVIALLLAVSAICVSGYMMTTDRFWGVDWVEEVHEIAVNATLVLVALHIGGVILASIEHKENLVRSMINGKKRR